MIVVVVVVVVVVIVVVVGVGVVVVVVIVRKEDKRTYRHKSISKQMHPKRIFGSSSRAGVVLMWWPFLGLEGW